MKSLPLVAITGIVVLAMTGCADPGSGTEGRTGAGETERTQAAPSGPDRSTGEPASSVAPKVEPEDRPGDARIQEGTPLPDDRIDGSALHEDYPRRVNLTADGTVLAIVAVEGGCGRATAELVEQTGERVTVLLGETKPTGEFHCTMDIRHPTVTVRLAEPLGQRTVVLRPRDE